MGMYRKIGLGGGCHWCTEAVFQSLIGVHKVEQGFIASAGKDNSFSEAVIVHFDEHNIGLKDLILIHLHTHESAAAHTLRDKYRSAIYSFTKQEEREAKLILKELQIAFEKPLITEVLPFKKFKASDSKFHNYYYSDKEKPFCKTYIHPKLKLLLDKFGELTDPNKL